MLKDVIESTSVKKLQGIIHRRYGKVISIKAVRSALVQESDSDAGSLIGTTLHIPIQVHSHYFATALVHEATSLTAEEQLAISYMIKMVLEPEFYNWYLEQAAHNAQNAKQSENVISIFKPYDLYHHDLESIDEQDEPAEEKLICLESSNPHLIPRLSYEIHELSGKWAFLKFSDIQDQVKSIQDIMDLGDLTLLVEDVLNLSPFHRTLIQSYIESGNLENKPLILIGATSKIESLESQEVLTPSFARLLIANRLETERLPKDQKLLQETLEFMLHI